MAQNKLNPLAQTFNVDSTEFSSGFFLHSVDLWFFNKDLVLPVHIQIRPVVNGYPDVSQVVPFADILVASHNITVTDTPLLANATNIKFPTPPYLIPGEYALVVLADSIQYELYVARVGEKALSQSTVSTTGITISTQPYSGVLFKASNSSTFLPIPEEDLMFRMYRSKFQTGSFDALLRTQFDDSQTKILSEAPYSKPNTVHFKHDATGNTGKFSYNASRINSLAIKDFKTVSPPRYQYLDRIMTDEVTGASTAATSYKEVNVNRTVYRDKLSDVSISSPDNRTGTGIIEEGQPNSFNVKMDFTLSDNIISPIFDTQQMNVQFIQNRIDDVEINPAIDLTIKDGGTGFAVNDELLVFNSDLETTAKSVVVTDVTTDIDDNPTAHTGFKDGKSSNVGKLIVSAISGQTITGSHNGSSNTWQVGEVVHQGSSAIAGVVVGTNGDIDNSGDEQIAVTQTAGTWVTSTTITGQSSGATMTSASSVGSTAAGGITALTHPTSANDAYRSRRLTGSISIGTRSIADATATNAIIQLNDERDPSGGIADARYVTKSMMLKEGFESEDIKVLVNAVRPKGTQIFVYYKIRSAEDSEVFGTRPWNRLYELTNSDDFSQIETDVLPLEFVSYKKNSDGSIDKATIGGTRYSSNGSNYEKFSEYAIKIVMASDSTNMVPLVESMGGLALIDPIQPAT